MFYFDNNSIFNEIQTSDLVYTKKWTNKTNANAFAEKKVILFQKHVAPTGFMLWKKHISGARAAAMLTKNVSSGVAAGANSFLQELRSPALLTQDIEDSFSAKKKAAAVFVDFTAAYDTGWNRGLTCKLLHLLPDRHMVRIIMEMVTNRSFTLITGNGKRSRLRRIKNVVPQGSALAPLLWTSTSLTCQPPSPQSVHVLTI